MKLVSLLRDEKFILEVTTPQTVEFIQAAVDGGAQAIKVRCNQTSIERFSNGVFNGPFQTRRDYLEETLRIAGDIPVGLVPGNPQSFITADEKKAVEGMGFDYFNISPEFVPCYMFEETKLSCVLALVRENMDDDLLNEIGQDPLIDAIEANIVPMEKMGSPFCYEDVLRYRSLVKKAQKPVIATAQKMIRPEEIHFLYESGCKALMIGVGLFAAEQSKYGGQLTAETVRRTTEAYREAIEKL